MDLCFAPKLKFNKAMVDSKGVPFSLLAELPPNPTDVLLSG